MLYDTQGLCERIERRTPTMREWRRQRRVYEARETAGLRELGFAAFFLNRTNRSGIIGGGVIGGKKQTGRWHRGEVRQGRADSAGFGGLADSRIASSSTAWKGWSSPAK